MDESAAGRSDARLALARLDLNLVVYLDALLSERSVTRAASRVSLSQPAMSAALARLRAHFDDPLMVRRGRSHEPTSLGVRLAGPVAQMIEHLHGVFAMSAGFDPTSEVREFVVHGSDHSATVIGALVRRIAAEVAPGVRLRFVHREIGVDESPGTLLARNDGALLPHGVLFDSSHIDVFEDRWVCIVARQNPAVGSALTVDNLAQLPWVTTHHNPSAEIVIGAALERAGIRPRIATIVDGFLSVPHFVSGTDGIAVVQERLARDIPPALGLRVVPTPFEIEPHRVAFWWHAVHTADPAHAWLRSLFVQASRRIAPLGSSSEGVMPG